MCIRDRDNTASPADRWYSGAGIYRTVKLLETEAAHLEEMCIRDRCRSLLIL